MPRRSVLTVTQLETLLAFPATELEMARYYTFDDRDLAIIRQRRVPKIDWVLQSNYATSGIPVRPWLPKRRRQTACWVTYRNSYA
jgi:hypothetical protein